MAPTVLDLLGLPPPSGWQGRSLFRPDRSGRVYFFNSFSDQWFGYREGDRKVLYNATRNRFEVYDLAADPEERVDRSAEMPEVLRVAEQRLAAWVQYQNRRMRALLDAEAERRQGTARRD